MTSIPFTTHPGEPGHIHGAKPAGVAMRAFGGRLLPPRGAAGFNPKKPRGLIRKAYITAQRKIAPFQCQDNQRDGRASPLKNKMLRSEFFYWEYPYKQTKVLEFSEVQNFKAPPELFRKTQFGKIIERPFEITEKQLITNRMIRLKRFLEAPKKCYIHKPANITNFKTKLFCEDNSIVRNNRIINIMNIKRKLFCEENKETHKSKLDKKMIKKNEI